MNHLENWPWAGALVNLICVPAVAPVMFRVNVLKESVGRPVTVAVVLPLIVPPPMISTTASVMSGFWTSGGPEVFLLLIAGDLYAAALNESMRSPETPSAGVVR